MIKLINFKPKLSILNLKINSGKFKLSNYKQLMLLNIKKCLIKISNLRSLSLLYKVNLNNRNLNISLKLNKINLNLNLNLLLNNLKNKPNLSLSKFKKLLIIKIILNQCLNLRWPNLYKKYKLKVKIKFINLLSLNLINKLKYQQFQYPIKFIWDNTFFKVLKQIKVHFLLDYNRIKCCNLNIILINQNQPKTSNQNLLNSQLIWEYYIIVNKFVESKIIKLEFSFLLLLKIW